MKNGIIKWSDDREVAVKFTYRLHAIERMFERDIEKPMIENAIKNGEIIEEYEDDKPYPSYLVLFFENGQKRDLYMLCMQRIKRNTL